jgi:hypothetical protein
MSEITIIGYLIEFVIFTLIFVFFFYPVGFWLLRKSEVELFDNESVILSLLMSLVGFVLLTIILGVLNLRFLNLPIIVVANLLVIKKLGLGIFRNFKYISGDKILLSLILIAAVVQGVINFPSGASFDSGLLFWSSQGNDGLWHVALMEEVKKSMPLLNPIYAGIDLKNYHFLVDIMMGEFGRLSPLFSSLDLYFRYFPPVFSFLISLSVYSFLKRWKNKTAGYWAIIFTSLAGGFGYIVTLIKQGKLFAGETVFWAAQGNTIIGNPPHAVAYAVLSGVLLSLTIYIKTRNKYFWWITLFLAASLSGYKISAGVILNAVLLTAGAFDLMFNRKKEIFLLAVGALVCNGITVLLMSQGAQSFLVFEPWWFVRTSVVVPERVGWLDMELRRQHYVSVGTWKAWLRVIQLETMALTMFVIGNLGTRIIGIKELSGQLFQFKKLIKSPINGGLLGGLVAGFIIPMLFVQKGIAYNLIQFFQYFILIFGFFAAVSIGDIVAKFKNILLRRLIILLFILVSLPTVIGNVVEFYGPGRTPLAKISNDEINALNYLKENTGKDDVILTIPFNDQARYKYKAQPWPISGWYSTAYVSALSSRRTYLSNESQADILGIGFKERAQSTKRFFSSDDLDWKMQFLSENSIDYIYIYKNDLEKMVETYSEKVYENDEVVILKV